MNNAVINIKVHEMKSYFFWKLFSKIEVYYWCLYCEHYNCIMSMLVKQSYCEDMDKKKILSYVIYYVLYTGVICMFIRHRHISPISASATENIIFWCIPAVLRCAVLDIEDILIWLQGHFQHDEDTVFLSWWKCFSVYFLWVYRYTEVAL